MQVAGTLSWHTVSDEPRLLLLALYVRDAAGLEAVADPPVPRLEPAVPSVAEAPPAVASAQWSAWWRRLVVSAPEVGRAIEDAGGGHASLRVMADYHAGFGPPGFEALRGSPELRDLVARHHEDAEAWRQGRKRDLERWNTDQSRPHLEHDAVREAERRLGWKARPFRLQISILPVAGDGFWRVGDEHVLVTRSRYLDTEAWRRDLQPIVDELARDG